nr:prolyl-tRNA synthetase associated domain-containing protein [Lactobacillus delbrueckii]
MCAFKRRIAVFEEVKDKLAELGIDYQLVEHAPALTTEQADEFIEGIPGVRTKTLFLTNKKKRNFYLVIMDDAKRLNMDKFKEIAGEKQIKMASEKSLFEKMGLPSRVVSPFGLLNNADHDIQVYFDKEIVDEDFHPNNNEKTIFIKTEDLFKFLKNLGYEALTR